MCFCRKEKISVKKYQMTGWFCLEKVMVERCNMVVLRLDGECMNPYLTTTNFESTRFLSTNKPIVLQLLVDKSALIIEHNF